MVNRKRSVIERGAIIMVYHYTDGFLTVLKENALKAWMNHEEVKIRYQNKDGGAFWTPEQMLEETDTQRDRRKQFDLVVARVREQIPHTRIKYIIKESVYIKQIS